MKKQTNCGLSAWPCWVHVCDWLDSTSSASAGGKDADPTFGSFVWWRGSRPHAVGRGNRSFISTELSPVLFITGSHQREIDTRSIIRWSIIVGG